jgi:hypothetical protein
VCQAGPLTACRGPTSHQYAPITSTAPSRPTVSRAALRNRPTVQRALIRYGEHIKPVRVTVLAIRLLVAAWLVFLGGALLWAGRDWAWLLFLAAVGVAWFGLWTCTTAAKGWPAAKG